MQKYIILHKSINIGLQKYNIQYAKYTHIIYTQYTKVQSVYIIRQAKIDKRTKPFCFYEWYWIRVCATQFRYELSITRRWQEVVQTAIRLGNTV